MNRPTWITSDELKHNPDNAIVILQGRIHKIEDLVPPHGKNYLSLSFEDFMGKVTVLADKRFEYVLIDKELPVLVVGKKVRMDGQAVVVADSLNFPVQPSMKFKHVLAALESR